MNLILVIMLLDYHNNRTMDKRITIISWFPKYFAEVHFKIYNTRTMDKSGKRKNDSMDK